MADASQSVGLTKKEKIENIMTQTLVRSSNVFIKTSLNFIHTRMEEKRLTSEMGQCCIKEILHSVFFIGHINKQRIAPKDVLCKELYSVLLKNYPDVFVLYESQLPHRPPFSVLLEVVAETFKAQKVDAVNPIDPVEAVLRQLAELIGKMVVNESGSDRENDICLGAAVVSYCFFKDEREKEFETGGKKTQNYFGASVGCSGKVPKKIFIDLACISTWNRNVAHAVYLAETHKISIRLPSTVYCFAFLKEKNSVYHNVEEPPCLSCCTLFPNVKFTPEPPEKQLKPSREYGNCAECEAISNLLNAEPGVSKSTEQLNTHLPRLDLQSREKRLRENLQVCQFNINQNFRFYNPKQ